MIVVVAALCFVAGAVLAAWLLGRRPATARSEPVTNRSLPAPAAARPSGEAGSAPALTGLAGDPGERTLARRILGAIDVGVAVVNRDEVVLIANRAATETGVVVRDRLNEPVLLELVRTVLATGTPDSATVDLRSGKAGPDQLTYLVSALPLDEQGYVSTVLLRFSDVTEGRRLERVRRDFVANVSHELKTPVGALTLLAEAVQDASDDPVAVQRFAHRMQREGARLGRLVQELIELSRLQGAEPLPGQDLVDVDHIISEAVDRSRLLAEQSEITVVDRSEPGLQVRGNETQLATAIANLVDNAIAYSSEHTKVGVSSRSVTDEAGRQWVEIAVTDQGIGIEEPDLDRVFERFFRVDPARSRATGGTGLGLAIVKHVASNHGGSVSVWSVVGSGSTFTVQLPLAARPARSHTGAPNAAGSATVAEPFVKARAVGPARPDVAGAALTAPGIAPTASERTTP